MLNNNRSIDPLLPSFSHSTIAVIGLGYVGLPLATTLFRVKNCVKTGQKLSRSIIGFDISKKRIDQLSNGIDVTNELSQSELSDIKSIKLTTNIDDLYDADVFIITVPTPIDSAKQPDLASLEKASSTIGQALSKRSRSSSKPIIIYESTVFPGATEDVCVPILEHSSKLTFNQDFYCGYSPERINPGDKKHRLTDIKKVTSGSLPKVATWVDNFYGSIVKAGTHKATSMKVAEAAKVIENTQRDVNIALINELALILHKLDIDTLDVLEAASSKWNFLLFKPGLVGGHCIGVDPYYLTHKAESVGYHPQVLLAGRRINDGMAQWIVQEIVLGMVKRSITIPGSRVLFLGFTFKENCPDFRNTKIIDMIKILTNYGAIPVVVDPWANIDQAKLEFGINLLKEPPNEQFSVIVVGVAHDQFKSFDRNQWSSMLAENGMIFDLKGFVPRDLCTFRL